MAAANESQGLKIAVAVFVSLTVILSVTSYFLYSSYSHAVAAEEKATKDKRTADTTATQALTNLSNLKAKVGYPAIEDPDALTAAIKKDEDKLTAEVNGIITEVKKKVAEYQQAGGSDPKIKELEASAENVFASYRDEPNKTYASSLNRLKDLLSTEALLTTAYAIDNLNLRKGLESSNQVNQEKVNTQEQAVTKSKQDLEAEHTEHEKIRQDLIAKVDKVQTDFNNVNNEFENFRTKTALAKEEYEKRLTDLRNQLAYYKDQAAEMGTEPVIDSIDGLVTAVDYTQKIVRTNLSKSMGVRPQQRFAVFDQHKPIPNDHPKAHIELISVNNTGSIARILPAVRTGQSLQSSADIQDPIHKGDYLYSPAYNPNEPKRIALIGKIDINRDGKDDRDDLKRMIKAAGGMIEYDLPPPGAGKESGKLTGLCSYYVVDNLPPLINRDVNAVVSDTDKAFYQKKTEAMKEARSLGIQPMSIERLLIYLGYNANMAVVGRTERFDQATSDAILYPRGRMVGAGAGAGGGGQPASSDTPPAAAGQPAEGAEAPKEGADAPK